MKCGIRVCGKLTGNTIKVVISGTRGMPENLSS